MFRLTNLPGHNGGPPTDEWADIKSDGHAKLCVEGVKKRRPKSDWFKGRDRSRDHRTINETLTKENLMTNKIQGLAKCFAGKAMERTDALEKVEREGGLNRFEPKCRAWRR
jgi:hypothetical protein